MITDIFTPEEIYQISYFLHYYFDLVETKRIFDLILQVNSIDVTLHLLMCHKTSEETLDNIVYSFLHHKDNK